MVRKFLLVCVGVLALGVATASAALPPGTQIDLLTAGNTYTDAGGAIWNQFVSQPTGTGYINPFLRVRATGIEEGFNTDFGSPFDPVGADKPPLDDVSSIWTHNLVLGDIVKHNVGGTDYYVFHLDINEPDGGGQNFLSLDELRMYTSATGSYDTYANMVAGSALRWDMDGALTGNQTAYLDYNLASGSGQYDMELLVPASYFAGAAPTDFLYLYCKFGAAGDQWAANWNSQDGFEEWSTETGTPPRAPEPSTMLLLGGGLVGMLAARRRK